MNARSTVEWSGETRGVVSIAVLIFFAAALAVCAAMYMTMAAAAVSLQSFDAVRFQTLEKNGLAQVVEQSILAVRGTLATNSTRSIEQEISNRLGSLNLTPGVMLTLATQDSVPQHSFYPMGAPAPLTACPEYSAADTGAMAGKGMRLFPYLEDQAHAYLGRSTFTFNRTVSAHPGENRIYTVKADLYSVPLTNIPIVAYGLPNTTGIPPLNAPTMPILLPAGARRLVMTSNNPANDPTACPDYFSPVTPEQWPAQFGPVALWCWDAYEYIWAFPYQNALLDAAGAAATYDFASSGNPFIAGISVASGGITIDLASVTSTTVAVVDSLGIGNVRLLGAASTGPAFILLIKGSGSTPTEVTLSGDNQRPFLLIACNCALNCAGNPSVAGAFLLDRACTAAGTATLFGHLSFYAGSSLFPAWNLTVNASPGYESAYAAVVPRVLLVSVRGNR